MMNIAREICPEFEVTPALQPVMLMLFDWCICNRAGKLDPNKALWICGPMGTGKSTLLRIIRRFASEVRMPRVYGDRYTAPMHYWYEICKATDVTDDYARMGAECYGKYLEDGKMAIDDLGFEPKVVMNYGVPGTPIADLISRQYDKRHNSFMHVTTNLQEDELREHYGARFYDRLGEMYNFVKLDDYSHRPSITMN